MPEVRPVFGFTLIEVLIAVLILVLVAALLVGSFHTGLMCYKKVNAYEKNSLVSTGALSLIKADIRRFVPLNKPDVRFREDSMSFYIASPVPESHLELISYSLDRRCLMRKSVSYLGKKLDEQGDEGKPVELLGALESLKFSYIKGRVPRTDKKKKQKDKKDKGSKKNKLYWPACAVIKASINAGGTERPLLSSLLFPIFDRPEKSKSASGSKGTK